MVSPRLFTPMAVARFVIDVLYRDLVDTARDLVCFPRGMGAAKDCSICEISSGFSFRDRCDDNHSFTTHTNCEGQYK